jgi:ribose 5-phosphate isomerase RpiB
MFVTVRQLEDLYRHGGSNGHVTLPYRARLTPLAQDWVRSKRVVLGYGDGGAQAPNAPTSSPAGAATSVALPAAPGTNGATLWWCDGPCGPAKAALVAYEKESSLRALDVPQDPRRVGSVVKTIAGEVKSGRSVAAVLMVQTGAAAVVFANRCPSLRAVLGTCLEAVEQGIQQVAANVLVIEYPHRTLQQMKNMLARFVRAKHELPEEVRRQLQEMASCG